MLGKGLTLLIIHRLSWKAFRKCLSDIDIFSTDEKNETLKVAFSPFFFMMMMISTYIRRSYHVTMLPTLLACCSRGLFLFLWFLCLLFCWAWGSVGMRPDRLNISWPERLNRSEV